MLETIVLAAEAATATAILLFCTMVWIFYREGRILPAPKSDPVGDVLRRHAKIAIISGYSVFFAATAIGLTRYV